MSYEEIREVNKDVKAFVEDFERIKEASHPITKSQYLTQWLMYTAWRKDFDAVLERQTTMTLTLAILYVALGEGYKGERSFEKVFEILADQDFLMQVESSMKEFPHDKELLEPIHRVILRLSDDDQYTVQLGILHLLKGVTRKL